MLVMLQGTGSDVGKSLLVAGICRLLRRRGLRVRPFKPQNMSNNAAVTADGGEIGRAQALQALACGIPASIHMNPVLLKPQSDVGSQIVVQGKVWGNATAQEYRHIRPQLWPYIEQSLNILKTQADVVVVEGAGSPAEINLREGDIANMGFATRFKVPVILVGDIDRGGVLASIVGTCNLLPANELALIQGYIINKFRGDLSLFTPALDIIKQACGLESLGVVAYSKQAGLLPPEDSMAIKLEGQKGGLKVVVPLLSRIANFDDFDPLQQDPEIDLRFIPPGQALPGDADWIILPGSKATIADLKFLRQQGWDIDIQAHWRRGGKILGICAGLQMLGAEIADPLGLEGAPGSIPGLGFLDLRTELKSHKILREIKTPELSGYEMHMGETTGPDMLRPFCGIPSASSSDGQVMGCYLHGLFNHDNFRQNFFSLREQSRYAPELALDLWADLLAQSLNMDKILALLETR